MARIMAFDYGRKRTGIAVTDPLQIIATGLTTVETSTIFTFLEDYLKKEEVEKFVVGVPLRDHHEANPVVTLIEKFIQKLQKHFPHIPVDTEDESFTSKMAVKSLVQGGVKKKKRRNKSLIDEVSATLILQQHLGHH